MHPPFRQKTSAEILSVTSRSIWKERYNQQFQFYCPMCALPRRLGMHPRPGQAIHFLQVGLCAIVFAFVLQAAFPWMGLKGLVSFIPFWMIFESIYRVRVRAAVRCGRCGFDPVLYLSDVDRARDAIREHWLKKQEVSARERSAPTPKNDTQHSNRDASSASSRSEGYEQNPAISSEQGLSESLNSEF